MVVKRKTHSTRLDGLQTCRTACAVQVCPRRVAFERLRLGGSEGPLTERSLQLNGSHHDRITELVIHQQQPESQDRAPPCRRSLWFDRTQRRGWPHTAVKQAMSQCHSHSARYHTTTCQQLPTPQRESLHHAAQPAPFDGLGSHTSLEGLMIHQPNAFRESQLPRVLKVEAPRRVGHSDAFRRGPNRAAPSNTIIPFHTCKLAAGRTDS